MARQVARTKILINGDDVGRYVFECSLQRFPVTAETVTLTLEVDRLEVADDGTLIVHVKTEEADRAR